MNWKPLFSGSMLNFGGVTYSYPAGWWFQIVFVFTPNLGEDEPTFDEHIFQRG